MAMCLEFLKIPRRTSSGQFEDELYEYALNNSLDRKIGSHLAKIVRDYGAKDSFTEHATVEAVKAWLSAGNPAVTHGMFTKSGHIIALVGYDDTGFIVNDPYGEWFASGYDRNDPSGDNKKGELKHYSYELIHRTCAYDSEFWVHFISK
jgi:Peptidase_C39 like family